MTANTNPPVISYEEDDALVHTPDHPFCNDLTCPCHTDQELIDEHMAAPFVAGALTLGDCAQVWRGQAQERNRTYQCADGSWW